MIDVMSKGVAMKCDSCGKDADHVATFSLSPGRYRRDTIEAWICADCLRKGIKKIQEAEEEEEAKP